MSSKAGVGASGEIVESQGPHDKGDDRRPTARELAANGVLTSTTLKRSGYTSWFHFVAAMEAEGLGLTRSLLLTRHAEFFTLDQDVFATRFALGSAPHPADQVAEPGESSDFAEMVHELVDWRLAEYLDGNSAVPISASTSESPDGELTIGLAYMRADIPPFFGAKFNRSKWHQGIVTVDCGLGLLVTLDKGNAQEAHRYKDHFTSPTHFTWQSQNQTKKTGKHGRLIHDHTSLGKEIHLCLRKRPKLRNQTAAPFYYCGQLDFQSWEGEKPITLEWAIERKLSSNLAELIGNLVKISPSCNWNRLSQNSVLRRLQKHYTRMCHGYFCCMVITRDGSTHESRDALSDYGRRSRYSSSLG